MKKYSTILLSIFAFILVGKIYTEIPQAQVSQAHIEFEVTSHDYGTIQQNANGNFSFKFKNTGKEPLIIQNVQSSCGCTVAKRPTAPILPGESSEISVKYDTRRIGSFHKNITVTSNADNASVVLYIKGNVVEQPKEDVPVKPVNEGFTPVAP